MPHSYYLGAAIIMTITAAILLLVCLLGRVQRATRTALVMTPMTAAGASWADVAINALHPSLPITIILLLCAGVAVTLLYLLVHRMK